ncbi:patatin-like phospholipase family protein [Microbacterium flavum]|uniref:Patatin-like phospholipase family protein n=1 Tax=Microbacterium flavum TaxID=415216 RepID=A0ABS5XUY6_9MICO|nr:patatin-like phospholipase family protein [Microbacterium flavum]MBT8798349.1 patatin-like phospholipase family protein [Microbacterium flavum]
MRSLVLAGGGMRVAWQAGVMRALDEEGLSFDHVDGTSGGILTAAMMLSGVSGAEMCRRWRGLAAAAFGSALPVGDYLKGPWSLPALGDADGILHRVFPALGIDADAIRSSASRGLPPGTFNIAEFTTKTCLAVPGEEVDAELLAAGLSLPGWVTPLKREGKVYTDAVWIRDAGVAEAVRRGADEIWLVWCIGNTPYWGDGPLEQYVHSIELSAMGALLADFALAAALGRTFTLHVIAPVTPLPLDPEFSLGRIDSDALAARGYADARAYLDVRSEGGVPADASCTAMREAPTSVRITDVLTAEAGALRLTVQLPVHADLTESTLVGSVQLREWEEPAYLSGGEVALSHGCLRYTGTVRVDGEDVEVVCERSLIDDPGWDAWDDFTRASVHVGGTSFEASLGAGGAARLVASAEPVGAHGVRERAAALRDFWLRVGAMRLRV